MKTEGGEQEGRISDASKLRRAVAAAVQAHLDQLDKTGNPYFLHPLRVMQSVRNKGGTIEQQIAAVLHDAVEDTPITLLGVQLHFGDRVLALVDALTRRETDVAEMSDENGARHISRFNYDAYIERLVKTPGAALIKLCDCEDNIARMAELWKVDPAEADRLEKRYHQTVAKMIMQWSKEQVAEVQA